MTKISRGAVASALLMGTVCTSVALAAQDPQAAAKKRDCAVIERLTGLESSIGDIAAVLFEFQKMAGKEAREDSKTATLTKELANQQKSAKLRNGNTKIDKQMTEADEKADATMSAATSALVMGAVSTSAAAIGGFSSGSAGNDREFQAFALKTDALKQDLSALKLDLQRAGASAEANRKTRLTIAEIERMKSQLGTSLQQVRAAKRSARPC